MNSLLCKKSNALHRLVRKVQWFIMNAFKAMFTCVLKKIYVVGKSMTNVHLFARIFFGHMNKQTHTHTHTHTHTLAQII